MKCLDLGKTVKDPTAGSVCMVAGWGKTDNNVNKMSDVLMSVNVTVVDRVKCGEYYNKKPVITKDMICAGSDGKNNADTCKVSTHSIYFEQEVTCNIHITLYAVYVPQNVLYLLSL